MSIYTILHFSIMACAGILFVSAVAKARGKKGTGWLRSHRKLALGGAAAVLLALGSMAYLKFSMNYPHFKSLHAMGGLVTVFAALITPIFGNLVAAGNSGLRTAHRYLGRTTVALFFITAVFGVLRLLQTMKVI